MTTRHIRLHMLGKPALYMDGREERIAPPATFQLLAVILLGGQEGVSRHTARTRLWPHLDPKSGMTQLRINLMKMRDQLGDRVFLDTAGQVLRVLPGTNVEVDIWEKAKPGANGLSNFVDRVVVGWNLEHWQDVADQHGERICRCLDELEARGERIDIELLCRAAENYPTITNIHRRLVARYLFEGRDTDANEATIRFEEYWVERFGTGDIPDLSAKLESPIHVAGKKPWWNLKKILLAVVLLAGASGFTTWNYIRNFSTFPATIEFKGEQTWQGDKLVRYSLRPTRGHTPTMRMLSDGRILVYFTREGFSAPETAFSFWPRSPGRLDIQPEAPNLRDRNKKGLALDLRQAVRWDEGGQIRRKLSPTGERPNVYVNQLTEGGLFYTRLCRHLERCHLDLYFTDGNRDIQIVGPDGPPQTTRLVSVDKDRAYLIYSMGITEAWKNWSAFITMSKGAPKNNVLTPFAAEHCIDSVAHDGTVVLNRDVTSILEGDYSTRSTGERLLCRDPENMDSPRAALERRVNHIGAFGNAFITEVHESPGVQIIRALDTNGLEISLPFGKRSKLNSYFFTNQRELLVTRTLEEPEVYDLWVVLPSED